jgi:hypothetical protein
MIRVAAKVVTAAGYVRWRTPTGTVRQASSLTSAGERSMVDRSETMALEHDYPVAWSFVSMILAGGLGWTMLTLVVQA